MLPTANAVPSTTGTLRATSARPLTPVQLVPSRKTIVADTPGIPRRVRRRSSWAWSRVPTGVVVRRGLASAVPSGGGACGAPGGVEAAAEGGGDGGAEGDGVLVAAPEALGAGEALAAGVTDPPAEAEAAGVGTAAAIGGASAPVAAPATATAA